MGIKYLLLLSAISLYSCNADEIKKLKREISNLEDEVEECKYSKEELEYKIDELESLAQKVEYSISDIRDEVDDFDYEDWQDNVYDVDSETDTLVFSYPEYEGAEDTDDTTQAQEPAAWVFGPCDPSGLMETDGPHSFVGSSH